MFRVFIIGLVLGLAAAGTAAYFLPVTDLTRETSIVTVQPNGGTAEVFHILVPDDRMLAGTRDGVAMQPGTLRWPAELQQEGVELELFRLRNRDGLVVGVASRLEVANPQMGSVAEWLVHLPARGTLYFPMPQAADVDGVRQGELRTGTREFAGREGFLRERFVPEADGGRLELATVLRLPADDEAEVIE